MGRRVVLSRLEYKRYTKKSKKFINAYEWNCDLPTKTLAQMGMNKLGEHEDIEEELGIDLVTFFKYLSAKEVFFINDHNEVRKAVVRSIDKKGLIVFEEAFYWGECDFTLYFNDYGKKWALTKEELQQ